MDNPKEVITDAHRLAKLFRMSDGSVAQRIHTSGVDRGTVDYLTKHGFISRIQPFLGNGFGLEITPKGRALIS